MESQKNESKTQIEHVLYSRDVLHKHSPATQRLLDLCLDYIPYCNRQYKAGKNVIWALTSGPISALIYSVGGIPASITEIGRLSGPHAIAVAEDYFQVPNETCAMVKTDIGEFYLRRGEIARKLVYTSRACEPYNQAFELLKDYGYDVHVIDVGFKPDNNPERFEEMKKFYYKTLKETISWMGGKSPDDEEIRTWLIFYNQIQKKLRKVLDLRAEHPTYIGSLPTMLLILANTHYYGRPQEYEKVLDDLTEELEGLQAGSYHEEKAILGWSGSRGQEFNIYEAIDEAGGAILAWNLPNNIVSEFDTKIDPVEACVNYEIGDFNSGTTEQACQSYQKLINRFHAKGIVLYTFLGCSFMTIDIELKRKYFKERNIPSLALIGAFDVGSVSGQVATRIRAFVEMLSGKEEDGAVQFK